MSTAFKAAADEMRLRIQEKIGEIKSDPRMEEVLKLHRSLNSLEDLLFEPQTPLEQLFGLTSTSTSNKPKVRHDEFAGRTPLEAAKMYLKKMTDARPFKEIVAAIMQGGGKVDSENQLATSLGRSTLDIVKINDAYGWIDNYPHIKAQRKPRKAMEKDTPDVSTAAIPMEDKSQEIPEEVKP